MGCHCWLAQQCDCDYFELELNTKNFAERFSIGHHFIGEALTMKKTVEKNQPTTTQATPPEIDLNYNSSSPALQEYSTQIDYVPLLPTETGRKRHDAHQLNAPNHIEETSKNLQDEHPEIYLG